MNLLHIIPRFIGGGPERHLLALAAAWRRAGREVRHTCIVLTAPASALLVVKARRLGIELRIAPPLDVIREAMAAADVVEITFWNHPALYALLRESLPSARWVLYSAVAGTTPPQVLIDALGEHVDAVITSTSASLHTPALAVAQCLGCRIDTLPFLADMERLEGFRPQPHDGIRVGYLGTIETTKMHPAFAHLAARVKTPDVHFDVYGDGSWSDTLRAQCHALGIADRVHFHGHVEDIRTALATMDIFGYPLTPDTYATSEKVIQEAMWVGLPPIVLASSAPASLVEHEHTGLICQSEDEYPTAIERLATDAVLRTSLATSARRFARDHFDAHRNAARFLSVFEEVGSRPRRAWIPLSGRDGTGAACFVQSLGHLGGDFATSLAGVSARDHDTVRAADDRIAAASAVLAHGEGGIVHYRTTFPHDPHLRLWSGRLLMTAGRHTLARQEFEEAIALGIDPRRIPSSDASHEHQAHERS
jgi:glycosyltransferase involved in cell wall biosynthesis